MTRRRAGVVVAGLLVWTAATIASPTLPEDRQFVTDLTALTHVDLVIEHGPHVLQPIEKVNGTWVYWSVGNFISGMGTASRGVYADPRTLDELVASARVHRNIARRVQCRALARAALQ